MIAVLGTWPRAFPRKQVSLEDIERRADELMIEAVILEDAADLVDPSREAQPLPDVLLAIDLDDANPTKSRTSAAEFRRVAAELRGDLADMRRLNASIAARSVTSSSASETSRGYASIDGAPAAAGSSSHVVR